MTAKEFDTVLIDGDQMMYTVGFAAEGEPLKYVLGTIKKNIDKIQKACNAEHREIWVKGTDNFRDKLSVSRGYKSTRRSDKPKDFEEIFKYILEYQGAKQAHGMEADDMLSVRLYEDHERGYDQYVLASQDKDLLNTPGWHHNPRKPAQGLFHISPEEADMHFWYQMLAGDTVDNIPGLPGITRDVFDRYDLAGGGTGISSKRAWEIVYSHTVEELPRVVRELYGEWFAHDVPLAPESMVQQYFIEQGRLLWMARHLHEDGSPVLWEPSWYSYD